MFFFLLLSFFLFFFFLNLPQKHSAPMWGASISRWIKINNILFGKISICRDIAMMYTFKNVVYLDSNCIGYLNESSWQIFKFVMGWAAAGGFISLHKRKVRFSVIQRICWVLLHDTTTLRVVVFFFLFFVVVFFCCCCCFCLFCFFVVVSFSIFFFLFFFVFFVFFLFFSFFFVVFWLLFFFFFGGGGWGVFLFFYIFLYLT